jgi:hypothetical protein
MPNRLVWAALVGSLGWFADQPTVEAVIRFWRCSGISVSGRHLPETGFVLLPLLVGDHAVLRFCDTESLPTAARMNRPQKSRPALAGGGLEPDCDLEPLFLDLINAIARSVFVDSILRPCFLAAVERKPRTLWACQSVAFWISARLAPFDRPISARIFAPLLSARGVLAFLASAGLAAFWAALTSFVGAGLALPPLAAFWPLGAAFFGLAPFLRGGFLRRNRRALFPNSGGLFCNGGGVFGGTGFCGLHGGESFLRLVGA